LQLDLQLKKNSITTRLATEKKESQLQPDLQLEEILVATRLATENILIATRLATEKMREQISVFAWQKKSRKQDK